MKTNRRTFLSATAAAGGLALARGGHVSAAETPNNIRIGLIGAGGYGMTDSKAALRAGGAELVAVCDVDSEHLEQSAAELEKLQGKRPQAFKLYDDLLAMDALDAVIIAAPPHWHALPFLAALKRGVDIYCEKPLAYDVREGRAMVDAAAKSDRVVQIGFQRRQSKAFQEVKEFIAAGEAGEIVQVDVQIHYNAGAKDATPQPPPASLDWDLWCGPAPKIPYSPQVGHRSWRLEKTTGHGHLVDWGIHLIDATRLVLGLDMPRQVTAMGGIYRYRDIITTPDTLTAHFEFDRCPVVWRHRLWGAAEYTPEVNNGVFFFGDKATVFATDKRWEVIPIAKNAERVDHPVQGDNGLAHMTNFLEAVRSRQKPSCQIDDAFRSTATVQLGMISYETGTTVEWDAAAEQIVGNEAAAALLKRPYREPWQHPYAG